VPALDWAIREALPEHLRQVRDRLLPAVARTRVQVEQRLKHEINYWYAQAGKLEQDLTDGKRVRHRPEKARSWAEELEHRRTKRLEELERDAALQPRPPVVAGCALVVPIGWLAKALGAAGHSDLEPMRASDGYETDRRAIAAVLQAEKNLGRIPEEMAHNNPGYDIRSLTQDGHLIHIEVKGRQVGAQDFYISRNEVLVARNRGDQHRLAIVAVHPDGPQHDELRYLVDAFNDTEFGDLKTEGIVLNWRDAWNKGGAPL
jgi:hypothetical protein